MYPEGGINFLSMEIVFPCVGFGFLLSEVGVCFGVFVVWGWVPLVWWGLCFCVWGLDFCCRGCVANFLYDCL